MLKKTECFIQPFKLDEVKDALVDAGVEGITISVYRIIGSLAKSPILRKPLNLYK